MHRFRTSQKQQLRAMWWRSFGARSHASVVRALKEKNWSLASSSLSTITSKVTDWFDPYKLYILQQTSYRRYFSLSERNGGIISELRRQKPKPIHVKKCHFSLRTPLCWVSFWSNGLVSLLSCECWAINFCFILLTVNVYFDAPLLVFFR